MVLVLRILNVVAVLANCNSYYSDHLPEHAIRFN